MVIICQNINQSKRWKSGFKYADDLITNENCYNKLIDENPDIIILTEVTYPKNIEKALDSFSCYFNSDKYMPWNRWDENTEKYVKDNFLCNKIFIAIKEQLFSEISDIKIDDSNNDINHMDYLKISFNYKNERWSVIGLRLYHEYKRETNDIHNHIIESILKQNLGTKTIITGDFNNGFIAEEIGNYPNYKFNIHTLKRLCNMKFHYREPQYKLVTVSSLNVDDAEPIDVCNYDSNEWTHQLKNDKGGYLRRPIDHFIVSRNIKETEYQLIKDIDGVDKISDLFYYYDLNENKYKDGGFKSGLPDHRIIKLTIKE